MEKKIFCLSIEGKHYIAWIYFIIFEFDPLKIYFWCGTINFKYN